MINDGNDALNVFDFVPLAESGGDGGFWADAFEVVDGGTDGLDGDPVGAAHVVEQWAPATEVNEF